LHGRRFSIASIHRVRPQGGYVLVTYEGGMLLRLPIKATNMASGQHLSVTKLTLESIREVVALATQDELSWAFEQTRSGASYVQTSKQKSSAR
jgi:hypothetical protein